MPNSMMKLSFSRWNFIVKPSHSDSQTRKNFAAMLINNYQNCFNLVKNESNCVTDEYLGRYVFNENARKIYKKKSPLKLLLDETRQGGAGRSGAVAVRSFNESAVAG